jgi:DNA-binding CsgD family transcriptional regulator
VKAPTEKGILFALTRTFPALPYLGLGMWLTWQQLAYSGGAWLSDIEINGENIAHLTTASSISLALVCLLAALMSKQAARLLESRRCMWLAGAVGALGSVCVIIAGPYYIGTFFGQNTGPLFFLGGVLTGISLGCLLLRCGQIYSALSPQKTLIYVALSHLLFALVFFVVLGMPNWSPISGSPSLSGMLAFILALPTASFLVSLSSRRQARLNVRGEVRETDLSPGSPTPAQHNSKQNQENHAELSDTLRERASDRARLPAKSATPQQLVRFASARALPAAFWKFLTMLLLFSTVVSMIRANAVYVHPVDFTLDGFTIMMFLCIVLSLCVVAAAVSRSISNINFGSTYSIIALVIVVAIGCLPMFEVLDPVLNLIIATAQLLFEFVLYCLLVFICYQKRVLPVVIFGLGYGIYRLGGSLGWLIGTSFLVPYFQEFGLTLIYQLVSGFLLVLAFFLFSERDFDKLFAALNISETTLGAVLEKAQSEAPAEGQRSQGRFLAALEKLAAERDLSHRETDVFKYLAMGRNTNYIAAHLHISYHTVRTHTHNVYVKIGVHSRSELMDLVDQLKHIVH